MYVYLYYSNPLAAAHFITMLEWITIYSSVRIHFHVSRIKSCLSLNITVLDHHKSRKLRVC